MGAVDPTYPLYPMACIVAAVMLLIVMLTSFIRQSWNLGVAFLCFWLFFENVAGAINAIIWFDNAYIKLYVYCDIVSRLDMICYVVKPMSTLIITRRLYLIASLQSVDLPSRAARRWNSLVEWTLGLIVPLLIAGPLYYVVQDRRFMVYEGFGCINQSAPSVLAVLLIKSWSAIPPLVSISFYYPKVARIFYRQKRDIDSFLRSNDSVTRTNYFRILFLASIDILLTFPVGVINVVLSSLAALEPLQGSVPFYPGWHKVHANWAPKAMTYQDLEHHDAWSIPRIYFAHWVTPVLAFVIFGLFGCTAEARASYMRMAYPVAEWLGCRPLLRKRRVARMSLGDIEFGSRPQDLSTLDMEIESHPSFADCGLPVGDVNEKDQSYATARFLAFPASSETHSECSDAKRPSASDSVNTVNVV